MTGKRPTRRTRRTLPSGVGIRRVRPSDQLALCEFYVRLSADSRRARFLGSGGRLSEAQALSFCTPDHQHAEGFVAVRGDRILGHLCLEPCGDARRELAVAVADQYQGRGIGRALFEAALAWAAQRGCSEIVASAYVDNGRVLRLLSSASYPCSNSGPEAGVVTVTIPLSAPLPLPWQRVMPAAGRRRLGQRPTGHCHVLWRRTRVPVRAKTA